MFLGITKRIEGKQGWCFSCYKSVSIQITRSLRYFTIKIRENLTEFDCLLFVNDCILWCDSIFTEHKKYWKNIFSSFYRKESTGRAQNTKEVMKIWYVLKMLFFHVFHVDMLWCRFIWSLSVLFHLLYLYVNKNTFKLIIFLFSPVFALFEVI